MRHEIDQYTKVLRDARTRLGLSQRELADRTEMTQAHISRIEKGEVDVQLTTLLDLARALGLELMLVPRGDAQTVEALIKSRGTREAAEVRPAYRLDREE